MNGPGKVLVTGGAGFLGSRVVPRLVADGWTVRCVVRTPERAHAIRRTLTAVQRERVDIAAFELDSVASCRAAIGDCRAVVHLAAAGTGPAATLFVDTVATTRRLATACVLTGARLVLVSSFSVYRTDHLRRGDVLDEQCAIETHPELRDTYAFSKLAQERVCNEAVEQHGLPLFIVRPAVIYGPGRGLLSSRVGLQIGGRLFRFGSRHRLPYVYVDNCADGVVAAARASQHTNDVVNLVDDELPSPRQLTRALGGLRKRTRVMPVPLLAVRAGVEAYSRIAEWSEGMLPPVLTPYKASAQWKPLRYPNAKAKRVLGWTPAVPLQHAIEESIAWMNGRS